MYSTTHTSNDQGRRSPIDFDVKMLSSDNSEAFDEPSRLAPTSPPPPLPEHWKNNFAKKHWPFHLPIVAESVFRTICLMSIGHANFESVWAICHPKIEQKVWADNRNSLSGRISTITIVAGLLLGTTAAFVTTGPPVPDMLNYNIRASYICFLISFGLTLGGLIVGSAEVFVMAKCEATWFRETLMGTRANTYCTIVFVAYPFVSIGIATIVGAFGILVAAWNSPDPLIRKGCVLLLIAPVSLVPLFIWTQLPRSKQNDLEKQ